MGFLWVEDYYYFFFFDRTMYVCPGGCGLVTVRGVLSPHFQNARRVAIKPRCTKGKKRKEKKHGQRPQTEGDGAPKRGSGKGQRPAATGPDPVRSHPTRVTRRSLLVRHGLFYYKEGAAGGRRQRRRRRGGIMRHAYLPLKQRQPQRAAGATMLMLSGL